MNACAYRPFSRCIPDQAWRLHVRALLDEAGLDEAAVLTDALLAPLAPDLFAYQRASGRSARAIADGLAALARRVLG